MSSFGQLRTSASHRSLHSNPPFNFISDESVQEMISIDASSNTEHFHQAVHQPLRHLFCCRPADSSRTNTAHCHSRRPSRPCLSAQSVFSVDEKARQKKTRTNCTTLGSNTMYNAAFYISIIGTVVSQVAASNLNIPVHKRKPQQEASSNKSNSDNNKSSSASKQSDEHLSLILDSKQPVSNLSKSSSLASAPSSLQKTSSQLDPVQQHSNLNKADSAINLNRSDENSNGNNIQPIDSQSASQNRSTLFKHSSSASSTNSSSTLPLTCKSLTNQHSNTSSTVTSKTNINNHNANNSSSNINVSTKEQNFNKFQNNYLLIYLLAVAADWIQGPYIYALYSSYGYSNNDIAHLYIAGFASSAVFGTFIASIADKYGRRKSTLIYCITYSLSCLTKHSPNFYVLLLGRILGGISYSILFSAFESWLIYEYYNNQNKFYTMKSKKFQLSLIFAKSQFGNGIIAIVSGLIAEYFSKQFQSKIIPFDLSICILISLFFTLYYTWNENYGNSNQSIVNTLTSSFFHLIKNKKILLLCIIQTCFESTLYTFTFIWTPSLQLSHSESANSLKDQFVQEIPHGTIFSTFMACTMIGSNLFTFLSVKNNILSTKYLMKIIFIIGTFMFLCSSLSNNLIVVYSSFLVFELLCGVYFPAIATVRAPFIPEENRSSLLTFFRIPLNIIVVIALYIDMSIKSVFTLCSVFMAVGVVCMHWLIVIANSEDGKMDNDVSANGVTKKSMSTMLSKAKEFIMGSSDTGNTLEMNGKDENC